MGAGGLSGIRKLFSEQSRERRLESETSWVAGLALFLATVYSLLQFDVLWVIFGITALTLYMLPIVSVRDPFRSLPWEMTILLAAPILIHLSAESQALNNHLSWWDDFASIAFAFAISTLGFLITIELQMYSPVKMNRPFAVLFVIVFTLAVSGFWQVGEYIGDHMYGTHYQGTNRDVMLSLFWNLVGGIAMGFFYDFYLRIMPKKRRTTLGLIHLYEVGRWKKD